MKILADVNVEKPIVDYLVGIDLDVLWIPDYNCMLPDEKLLNMANSQDRVLITNDRTNSFKKNRHRFPDNAWKACHQRHSFTHRNDC